MLFISSVSFHIASMMGLHHRYQQDYIHYTVAYAAALTGLRLAPQLATDLPIHPHSPTHVDFLATPPIRLGDITWWYIKTSAYIYSFSEYKASRCVLRNLYHDQEP